MTPFDEVPVAGSTKEPHTCGTITNHVAFTTRIDPEREDLERRIESFQEPSRENPPIVLCVKNVGDEPLEFASGVSGPFTQYLARDGARNRRLVIYPPDRTIAST